MSDAWRFADTDDYEDADDLRSSTKGGDYIRLKDGEEAIVVLPFKPFPYRQVWLNSENRSEIYDPEKHDGMRPQGRFMFACFQQTGETTYEAKAFDASGEAYDVIREAVAEYGTKTVFKLKRKGSGTDTKYLLHYKRDLEGGELDHVQSLEPLDAEIMALGNDDDEEATDTPEGTNPWG